MSPDLQNANEGKVPPKHPAPPGALRFGIDIDGTISQAPIHFKRLIDALLMRGDEVHIITARTEEKRQETVDLLKAFSIDYSELVMRPLDWLGTVGEFKVHEVRQRGIHMMIDDDIDNCWAIELETPALALHMLPIPEIMPISP